MTAAEGLRERKKRLTRRRISDTATALFLERGFDAVTVVEVARACEVSEKTVYNYFPTKESLVLDREAAWTGAVRRALGPDGPPGSPVAAVVAAIEEELDEFLGGVSSDGLRDASAVRRVAELIGRTPALRAANDELAARVVDAAAEAVAARLGAAPDDPEPQIVAVAVVGLWRVLFGSLHRHGPARADVLADVGRAARLLETGLQLL